MIPIKNKSYPKLRVFMHINGITQKMIAEWLNVSRQTVSLKFSKCELSEKDQKKILHHLLKYDIAASEDIFLKHK